MNNNLPANVHSWHLTDCDCAQYCRKITPTKYEFVQLQWLDSVPSTDCTYCVTHSVIDVAEMTIEDIKIAICGFYDSISALVESYSENMTLDSYCQIIAECAFENESGDNSITGMVTKEDGIQFILSYMQARP